MLMRKLKILVLLALTEHILEDYKKNGLIYVILAVIFWVQFTWKGNRHVRTCEKLAVLFVKRVSQRAILPLKYFKTESIRKLSNVNFQWTKTLYQNNLNNIA